MLKQTDDLVNAADRYAREQSGLPIVHLRSWQADKEKPARKRQEQTGIEKGLVGAWSCLESCWSYRANYCADKGYPQLRRHTTQCKHLYLYLDHEQYGWMNVRLQTWFQARGQRSEVRGQQMLTSDLCSLTSGHQWPHLLNSFLPIAFPTMSQTLGPHLSYYRTLWQSEWATVSRGQRTEVGGQMSENDSARKTLVVSVLRKIGFRPGMSSDLCPLTSGTDGLRVRHWVDHNSVKVYNEQNVLRIEATINMPNMFKVYRLAQGQRRDARKKLRPLRKGVADIPLRSQVSQEINNRLMDELSTFTDKTPLIELLAPHLDSRIKDGRCVRSLDISGKDRQLLQAVSDPDFTVSGITNAALRCKLASTSWGAGRTDKQLSARVTRHLRLLRDHGLIRKASNRRRYHLTDKGRQLTTALNSMLAASTDQLLNMAA